MIELHTAPTANGLKVSIMLEELGLPYRVHAIDLVKGEHSSARYLALNPVGRIPTIVDDGQAVYGTVAILLYLAEKAQRFMPAALPDRARVYEWLGIVSSDIAGAYAGQFAFEYLAPEKLPWAIDHYRQLCMRFARVLDSQLSRTPYVAGDEFTIADIAAYPVSQLSMKRYPGTLEGFPGIERWAKQVGARPAVERGMLVR